jgi:hypothetical protein
VAAVGGSVTLAITLGLLVWRVTILILVLAAVPLLVWTAWRNPARTARRGAIVAVIGVALTLIPLDLWAINTGKIDAGVAQVVWGLWMPRPGNAGPQSDVIAAGCARPLLNPARYVLWLSS